MTSVIARSPFRFQPLVCNAAYMPRRTRATVAKEEADAASSPPPPVTESKVNKADLVTDSKPSAAISNAAPTEQAAEEEPLPKKARKAGGSKKPKVIDHADAAFPERVVASSSKALGFHASASGGVETSCINALKVGCTAFALFLKNQRQWAGKPFSDVNLRLFPMHCNGTTSSDVDAEEKTLGDGKGFDRSKHIVPHGSYLVNLGNPTEEKWNKAAESFLDEAQRAEQLGIAYLNIHPGSSTGVCSREEAIASIAKGVNQVHERTSSVCILLENMAGKGNVIGGDFKDLADIIALVDNKSRVGVTLDTCHAFAWGHDLRTPAAVQETLKAFDDAVGLSYLKALHVNDSKGEFESHRDLHENIGCGHIGLTGFAALMGDSRLNDLPFILETPEVSRDNENYKVEIELLHRLEAVTSTSSSEGLEAAIQGDDKVQELFSDLKLAVDEHSKERADKKAKKTKDSPSKATKGQKKQKGSAKEEVDSDEGGGEDELEES